MLRGSGFPADTRVALSWSTVVGNRISGSGWEEATRDFATVSSDADGAFVFRFDTPDDLGGVHHIGAAFRRVPAGPGAPTVPGRRGRSLENN